MDSNLFIDDLLDPNYCSVFDDPKNGTPDNITQAGCLTLGRLGKKAWNAWREKYPARKGSDNHWINTADFSGLIFNYGYTNFQGYILGHGARFDGVMCSDDARFDGAQFGNDASFDSARFGRGARFDGAQFGDNARFDGTQFGHDAHFDGAQFGKDARFDSTQFGNGANFAGAQFDYFARFYGTQFGNDASFDGAQFGNDTRFDGAQFGYYAYFNSSEWALLTSRYSKRPGGLEAAKAWAEARGLSPGSFISISFNGAKFAGHATFSGRAFEGPTSFGRLDHPIKIKHFSPDEVVVEKVLPKGLPVVFGQAPLFHDCKLHQDTTFDGALFPVPSGSNTAARAYRTLKLAFAQQQATREEQLFFRLEMAEEAAGAKNSQRWLFAVYKRVSDYGFSLSLPTFWWLGFMLLFLLIYSWLAGLTLCLPWQAGCYIRYDLLQFTLLQALPLPGLDKWSYELQNGLFLPKEGWQSAVLTLVVMFQKAISLLAVFLFGLALRNLFKMK